MSRLALIDGDVVTYACGFASDIRTHRCPDGVSFDYKKDANEHCETQQLDKDKIELIVKPEPIEYCLHSVKKTIQNISEVVSADAVCIVLSGKGNFRDEVPAAIEYKANRKDAPKPLHYTEIRDYLTDTWKAVVTDGQEADDYMGIAQCNSPEDSTIICTIDKDLDMIPGWHYNWQKHTKGCYKVDEMEALQTFYQQLLKGDRVDNIFGLHGIGDVKARKWLAGIDNEADLALETQLAYAEAGKTPADYLYNGILLWIRREEDEIWSPPKEKRTTWLNSWMEAKAS